MFVGAITNNQFYTMQVSKNKLPKADNVNNTVETNYKACSYPVSGISFHAQLAKKIPTLRERYIGCLMGGAIGDAFGAPIEFLKYDQIKELYGENGLEMLLLDKNNKAYITDDTQMTLFTADGLIKSCLKTKDYNCEMEPDYNILYESYRDWHRCQKGELNNHGWISSLKEMYQCRAPGYTCLTYTQADKMPGSIALPTNNRNGNGGIMRIAPVGLLYNKNPELAFKVGAEAAALTHGNPNAYLSAGFQAALIAYILQGYSILDSINEVKNILVKYQCHENILQKVNNAIEYVKDERDSFWAIHSMGKSSSGDGALGIALYCALKYPEDYEKAIRLAVNFDGDSDTIGSIVGNIVGASVGENGIPIIWQRRIELGDEIYGLAEDLYWGIKEIDDPNEQYPID